jgi:hypothetical protein
MSNVAVFKAGSSSVKVAVSHAGINADAGDERPFPGVLAPSLISGSIFSPKSQEEFDPGYDHGHAKALAECP